MDVILRFKQPARGGTQGLSEAEGRGDFGKDTPTKEKPVKTQFAASRTSPGV